MRYSSCYFHFDLFSSLRCCLSFSLLLLQIPSNGWWFKRNLPISKIKRDFVAILFRKLNNYVFVVVVCRSVYSQFAFFIHSFFSYISITQSFASVIIIFHSIAGTQSGGISIQWILQFKNSLWLHISTKKLAQSHFQPFNLVYSTVDTTLNLSTDNHSNIFSLLALLLFPEQSREWLKK